MFIGLAVFIVYLYFFAGFKNIAVVLKGVNPTQYAFYYVLAIATVILGNFFWLLSWRNVLHKLNVKISVKSAFLYYWTGYFVDLVVPCETVCGELVRLYLVHKETDDDYGIIAAGGITNRIIAYIIVVTGLFSSLSLLFLKTSVPPIITSFLILIIIGATAYLAILMYLALSPKSSERIAAVGLRILRVLRPGKYRSNDFSPGTKRSLAAFYSGFKTFREKPRYLVKPFVYLTISWLFNLSQFILVFFALGLQGLPFAFFIVVYFIAGSVTDLTASFSVGTLDILLATIFILYGLNPALSGITAILVRSVTFWFPLIFGFIIVQVYGAKRLLAPESKEKSKPQTNQPSTEPATPATAGTNAPQLIE